MIIKKLNVWYLSSFLISIIVAIPIATVFISFFEETSNYSTILKDTFLYEYIFNSIFLLLGVLLLTFVIGSPILTALSSISSSMNLLNDKNIVIGSIIVMLFSIPVIIFSVGVLDAPPELVRAQLNILLGILMLVLAITPWISATCIRIALRNK